MQKVLNIAVVGCGYWGPNLIRNFVFSSRCKLKYICDLDPKRLEYLTRLYPGINATTHFAELVEDQELDAIVIATPVNFHFELARKGLEAGKHILLEKPMASSAAQCRELIDLAERKKLTLMVGHTFIYSSPVRMIKEIVERGEIGDILYISAQRLNLGLFQKDINVAWDLAPHDISIINYVMEGYPICLNCQGKAHVSSDVEDVTNMSLNYPNGKFATIQSSWLDPNKVRRMTFVGSKKMIVYDDTEPLEKIKIYDKAVNVPPHYETFGEFQFSYHYGDMSAPYIKQTEPLKVQCEHFLDCIINEMKPLTDGSKGLSVVSILEAASLSLKNHGDRIEIDAVRNEEPLGKKILTPFYKAEAEANGYNKKNQLANSI